MHKTCYVVVAQWDKATPKPAQRMKAEQFVPWVKKLRDQGHAVYSVYEAGCFGYGLHRQLKQIGVNSLVMAPNRLDEGNRVKCDKAANGCR